MILLLLLSAFAASTYLFGKLLLQYAPPIFVYAVRIFGAGLCFLGYYLIVYGKIRIAKRDWWLFAQVALVSFYASFVFEFLSLQYLTAAKTAFLYNLSPFVAAFFSYFFFHEVLSWKKWLGLLISLIGFMPILFIPVPQEGSGILFFSWAELGMLLAVLFFTYGVVLIRYMIKVKGYSFILINAIGMPIGGLIGLITAYVIEILFGFQTNWLSFWLPVNNLGYFILWMGLLIIIGNLMYFSLFGYLLKRYTATFVMLANFITPLFAALYGWLFLGTVMHWYFYVSCIMVLAGVYLFYQQEIQKYFEKTK